MTSQLLKKEYCDLKTALKSANVAISSHSLHFNLTVV
jgi:hypothetical protein